MNINNNFKSPGFWFVDIQDPENKQQSQSKKSAISKVNHLVKLKELFVRHLALALLIHETLPSGVNKYFINFDWKTFSVALMAPDNIWQKEFRDNLNRIIKLFSENNPTIKIIFLEEAVNTIKFPELEAPFNKADEIMRETSKSYNNVYSFEIQSAIINAAKRGEKVWQTPAVDPLHLKKEGNEIIANLLVSYLADFLGTKGKSLISN
jgi:hypothetical protein